MIRNMKRFARRTLAVFVGLLLGWFAAGHLPGSLAQATSTEGTPAASSLQSDPKLQEKPNTEVAEKHSVSQNSEEVNSHFANSTPTHGAASGTSEHGTPGQAGDHHEGGHSEAGALAAKQIVPEPEQIQWFPRVLWTAAALFVAAIVLGIPALKIRGPLPPDPADSHDAHAVHGDHHADHHDDAHSHAHAKTEAKHH